jgi:hypothetical protein
MEGVLTESQRVRNYILITANQISYPSVISADIESANSKGDSTRSGVLKLKGSSKA